MTKKTKIKKKQKVIILQEAIEQRIFTIQKTRVMVDRDLAEFYGVTTKALNQAVKRNAERFPVEFMFQLNESEKKELVTNCDRFKTMKHSSSLPYVFTEHGVAMLASVLKSEMAIKVSIYIVKTFIKLREYLITHQELSKQLIQLEKKVSKHDKEITTIVDVIKSLISEPEKKKMPIGFHPQKK